MDKRNGWPVRNEQLPLHNHIAVLSGRTSLELLQKSIMARVPIVCVIFAPSDLTCTRSRSVFAVLAVKRSNRPMTVMTNI